MPISKLFLENVFTRPAIYDEGNHKFLKVIKGKPNQVKQLKIVDFQRKDQPTKVRSKKIKKDAFSHHQNFLEDWQR